VSIDIEGLLRLHAVARWSGLAGRAETVGMEGETFGRYKLVSLLGEGGMAKVYLAVLSGPMGFEKEVALKKIDVRLTQDDRFVKALINEARLGGQLRHKNIVEVYEFNQVGEDYYLAMEYVDGWTLDTLVRNCRNAGKSVPPHVVIQFAMHICRGLDYAHSLVAKDGAPMNLVHRDLKPANVIVSRTGEAKIMDFGIAKADSNLYKTTAADITKGTPIYMSPEQVTGSSKLSGRSDIFSMGSIIHEMLCLDVIFHGDNLLAIMHKVLQADIRDAVKNVRDKVPGLDAVILKAMAKKPEDRYESAGAMERDLQGILDTLGPGPSIAEWLEEYQTWIPKKPAGGAPGKGDPKGTQSLAGMSDTGASDAEMGDFTQAFFTAGDQPAPSAPQLQQQSPTTDRPMAEKEMGELTKQFFSTGAEPSIAPAPPVQPERLAPAPPTPTPMARIERRTRKKKRGAAGLLIVALVVIIVFLLGAVGIVVALRLMSEPRINVNNVPDPVEDPTPDGDPVEPTTPVVEAGGDEVETGETDADADAAAAAAAEAERKRLERERDREERRERLREEREAREREKERERGKVKDDDDDDPVEPVATGTAYLTVNSKPWSTVYLDGAMLRNTPVKDFEIESGKHTLLLRCGNCTPPQEKTISFEVAPGKTYTSVRNEFAQQ